MLVSSTDLSAVPNCRIAQRSTEVGVNRINRLPTTMIGEAAGISPQGAYQRWGSDYDAIMDRNARATVGRRGKQVTTDDATNV